MISVSNVDKRLESCSRLACQSNLIVAIPIYYIYISTAILPLFTTLVSLSDPRVYILKGFPTTEADALQFLKENDAFFTSPASRREGQVQPTLSGAADGLVFLSALDAVMQLTTR